MLMHYEFAMYKYICVIKDRNSKREHLDSIAEQRGVPIDAVTHLLQSGQAHAELDDNNRLQRDYAVKVTPPLS